MRERLFTMRMGEDESARLDALAKHLGLNAAGTIRFLLKREADAIGFTYEPPKPAKAAKKTPKK